MAADDGAGGGAGGAFADYCPGMFVLVDELWQRVDVRCPAPQTRARVQ